MDVISYAKASSAYKLANLVKTGLTNKVSFGGSSIVVPVGTTATRPTLGTGESAIRYNSDVGGLEEWTGVEWRNVSADISAVTLKDTDTEVNILAKVGMVAEDLWIASDTLDGWVYNGLVWINIGPLQGPQGIQGIPGKSAYTVAVEGGFAGTEAQWLLSLVGVGVTGNGIASIVKTGTVGLVDTYTVTMTSGATATFTVTNGLDGVDGLDGLDVDHISKTSGTGASGTVDIYTIWLDVGETISAGTFNVYNGMDGAGLGDMLASVYDTTGNGIVDNAEKVNGLTVETAVPVDAVFTDTVYDDTDVVKAPLGVLPALDGSQLTNMPVALPDQAGFAGKYLKTDGTVATWESASTGTGLSTFDFVATAGQTVFSIVYVPGNIDVHHNGLLLSKGDYVATNGTSILLNTEATVSDVISITVYDTFDVVNTYTKGEIDLVIGSINSALDTINGVVI